MALPERAQSAVELLTSYGIDILIIAIVFAAIYIYISAPAKIPSPSCTFASMDVQCKNFVLASNALNHETKGSFTIVNSQPYLIVGPGLILDVNGTNTTIGSCIPGNTLQGGVFICTVNLDTYYQTGAALSGKLYLSLQNCGAASLGGTCPEPNNQIYAGTFYGFLQNFGALATANMLLLSAQNSTQLTGGSKDPISATLYLNGAPAPGASIGFTQSNAIYNLQPTLADTNPSGVAISYVWGNYGGTDIITASYGSITNSITVTFGTTTSTSTIVTTTSTISLFLNAKVTSTNSTADQGQEELFTTYVSGNTLPPYTYNILITNSINGNVVVSSTSVSSSNTYTYGTRIPTGNPNGVGALNLIANVVDSDGNAGSDTNTLSVRAQPTVTLSSNSVFDSGQNIVLTDQHNSGGWGTFSDTIYNITSGVAQYLVATGIGVNGKVSNTIPANSPVPSNVFSWNVASTDTGTTTPFKFNSVTLGFIINTALAVPTVTGNGIIDSGQSETLTLSTTGGTTPYSYQWYSLAGTGAPTCTTANAISGATGVTYQASPTSTTSYSASVTDSASLADEQCSAGYIVQVSPSLQAGIITPSSPTIDSGQSVTLTANAIGGIAPYSYQWLGGSSATCSQDSVIGGATGSTYQASPGSSTYYCYQVTDGSSYSANSPTDLVTVSGTFGQQSLSPSTYSMDAGQSVTLTASWSGGTSGYTAKLYSGTSSTCASDTTLVQTTTSIASTSTTFTVGPSSNIYYCAVISDSSTAGSQTATTATSHIIINPTFSVGSISPASPAIDSGQSVTLSSSPSGGTSPYTYQWYSGSSSTCTSDSIVSGATSSTYSPSPTSSTYYCYYAHDSSSGGVESGYSATDQITVNPALQAGAITPSGPSIDSGQGETLTAHPSGGTGTYSYQWYTGSGCSSAISGATSATYSTGSLSSTTTYSYKVSDQSAGTPAQSPCSSGDAVTVNPALSASAPTPSNPGIDSGQSVTLTASVSGGTSPYSYQWYSGSSSTCTSDSAISGATGSTYPAGPSSATYYCYKATDSSAAGAQSTYSGTDLVSINAAFVVGTVTPSTPKIDSGQSFTLTANPSGGTSPYSYQWYSGSSSSCTSDSIVSGATSSTYQASPSSSTYYCYYAHDNSYTQESGYSTTDLMTVNPAMSGTGISCAPTTIDSGQAVTCTVSWTGGTSTFTVKLYSGSSAANCLTYANLVSTNSGVSASPSQFTVYPVSAVYYCATIADSSSAG